MIAQPYKAYTESPTGLIDDAQEDVLGEVAAYW